MSNRTYTIRITQPAKEPGGERMSEFQAWELFGDSTIAALRAAIKRLQGCDDLDQADLSIDIRVWDGASKKPQPTKTVQLDQFKDKPLPLLKILVKDGDKYVGEFNLTLGIQPETEYKALTVRGERHPDMWNPHRHELGDEKTIITTWASEGGK